MALLLHWQVAMMVYIYIPRAHENHPPFHLWCLWYIFNLAGVADGPVARTQNGLGLMKCVADLGAYECVEYGSF